MLYRFFLSPLVDARLLFFFKTGAMSPNFFFLACPNLPRYFLSLRLPILGVDFTLCAPVVGSFVSRVIPFLNHTNAGADPFSGQ